MRVFSYGTLMFDAVMAAAAGRTFGAVPATLPGYARFRVVGQLYPGAVEQAGSSISGRLWLGVDRAALRRLDRFEGREYARRRLSVRTARGPVPAEAWVIAPSRRALLAPEPWDPEAFRRHLRAYLAALRATFSACVPPSSPPASGCSRGAARSTAPRSTPSSSRAPPRTSRTRDRWRR